MQGKNVLKILNENMIDTYEVNHFYQNIFVPEYEWYSLLSYTRQVTVRWACNFSGDT